MEYRRRLVDDRLKHALDTFPAVSVVGPRASGKTTSAARHASSLARLDLPATATAFRADIDAALADRKRPVLLDEWQEVPEVLAGVKRAVDTNHAAGQFLLTGSVSADLDAASWPGTGRVVRLSMGSMTQREVLGNINDRPTLKALLQGQVVLPADPPDVVGYVDLARRGGFPEATLFADDRDRRLWLDSYIEQLVTRDAARVAIGRDAARLRRYLQTWGLNSAGIVDDTTIYSAAGVDRRTHLAYEQLLEHLFVAELVPAWTSNRLKRLALAPKRYLSDSGLMCAAARIGRADVLDNGDLLGRVIDTFVFHELRQHVEVDDDPCALYHLRTSGGRQEIDLVVEFDGGSVFGVEVKATSTPSVHDAKHLVWLRNELGNQCAGGVVFHAGPQVIELAERIVALPIASLWGTSAR